MHDDTGTPPCNSQGICKNDDSASGYTCYCEPGFLGDDCEDGKTFIIIHLYGLTKLYI